MVYVSDITAMPITESFKVVFNNINEIFLCLWGSINWYLIKYETFQGSCAMCNYHASKMKFPSGTGDLTKKVPKGNELILRLSLYKKCCWVPLLTYRYMSSSVHVLVWHMMNSYIEIILRLSMLEILLSTLKYFILSLCTNVLCSVCDEFLWIDVFIPWLFNYRA